MERTHLTKQEWKALEPYLAEAEERARAQYLASQEARQTLGETQQTPGYLLLKHLRDQGDEVGVRLLRAAEMYQHELARADITAAYLRGLLAGRQGPRQA